MARVRLDIDWHAQVATGITHWQFPGFICPSEPNRQIRFRAGRPYVAPQSYGFVAGTWHVFDPKRSRHSQAAAGDGAFIVNGDLRSRNFSDGLSNTLAALEVKTYQPYLRNTSVSGMGIPDQIDAFQNHSGQFKTTGHTVWPDGRVHHAGTTVTYTPNRVIPYVYNNELFDIDYSTQQEGKSELTATSAAITSRSHHHQLVNSLWMDGSVRELSNNIDLGIYRALGTRAGGEPIQAH